MISVLLCVFLAVVVVLCVSSILWHRRQGELCDCPGDCGNCKIQCQSNVKYYGTAAQTMPVMTQLAKKRIRAESRLSKALAKIREGLDFVCYWLFNLCAIATLIRGLILSIGKLFG
jgi:hypothetical protein